MSKTETKQKPKKPTGGIATLFSGERWLGRNIFVILAFLIPFLAVFIVMAAMGVSPFGTKQILVVDLWHQYYPFLVDFQSKLKEGGSLFWTWTSGGGTNYLALMSYYLASPLNFFSVFVPSSALREFLYVITCIKIGLAGCFFAIFLRMTFKRNDITITVFGILYGLCSFIMGYYWCVIWLDTIALLPLVIAGTYALLKYGRFKLYIITLALSIMANYYIGLFTCFFVLFVCIGYFIVNYRGIVDILRSILKMAWCTGIALMITCILTVPAIYGLSHAHAASNSFPTSFAINIGPSADFNGVLDAIGQSISRTAALTVPTSREGLPNVYSGILATVMGLLFLTCSGIKRRERVYCGVLLIFFVLSFIIRQLDYIWHGFHFPNMLPHRFSFLFSFVLIYMAFRVYMYIDTIRPVNIIIAAIGFLGVVGLVNAHEETKSFIATALIGFVVVVWLLLFALHIVPKKALAIALFIIALAEGISSAYIGVESVTVTDAISYPLGGENTIACANVVRNAERGVVDLPRTEVTRYHTLNDNALIGVNGVSMFNSMTNEAISLYAEKFGICSWPTSNRYTYQESSPFTNLMLNIKYLISPQGKYLDTVHNSLIYQSADVKLMRSNYYVPMGFMVNKEILDFDTAAASTNPIDNQNELFRNATGLDGDLYEYLQVVSQGHTDYETFPVNKNSFGNYSFTINEGDSAHLKYNYEAPRDGVAVAYFTASGNENVSLRINDNEVVSNYVKRPYIMTFGTVSEGDKLSLYADITDATSGTCTVYCAMIDEELFQKGYEILSANTLHATEVTDTTIAGNIEVDKDGVFYTSIPYTEGWKAYVDGEEVEIKPLGDAMLCFELSKGKHIIRLHYVPEGFIPGLLITLFGLLLFAATIFGVRLYRKKRPVPVEGVQTAAYIQDVDLIRYDEGDEAESPADDDTPAADIPDDMTDVEDFEEEDFSDEDESEE